MGMKVSDALAMVSRPAAFAPLPQQGACGRDIDVLPGPSCPELRRHGPSIAGCRRYVEVSLFLLAPCWRRGFFSWLSLQCFKSFSDGLHLNQLDLFDAIGLVQHVDDGIAMDPADLLQLHVRGT